MARWAPGVGKAISYATQILSTNHLPASRYGDPGHYEERYRRRVLTDLERRAKSI